MKDLSKNVDFFHMRYVYMSMPSGVMLQRMPKNPMVLEHTREYVLVLYLEKKKKISLVRALE